MELGQLLHSNANYLPPLEMLIPLKNTVENLLGVSWNHAVTIAQ